MQAFILTDSLLSAYEEYEEHKEHEGVKKFLFVTRHAPYGTSFGKEGLDAVLMGSAFVPVTLLFMDDGVMQLKKNQHAAEIGSKDYSPTFAALDHYDVKDIYVSNHCLKARGLRVEDLVIPVEVIEDDDISELMQKQDVILSF